MKRIEVMLDLEFMGKPPAAAIVAIGAAIIDRDELKVIGQFHKSVSLESSIQSGGTVDASTIRWWLKQSDDVRGQAADETAKLPLVLRALHNFIADTGGENFELTHVWGYGATSDNIILRTAHERLGMDLWDFRLDSCFRTLVRQLGVVPWVNHGVAHIAGDDATAQALTLIEIYKAQK